MPKTFQSYINDAKSDIQSEGYEPDLGIYMDIAESMLYDPVFAALAKQHFGHLNGMSMKEAVAHSLC